MLRFIMMPKIYLVFIFTYRFSLVLMGFLGKYVFFSFQSYKLSQSFSVALKDCEIFLCKISDFILEICVCTM